MSAPRERRGAPANWLPYVAVAISLASMILGPCFGAAVAVVGNYVTSQNKSAVAERDQKQLTDDMKGIRESLQKLVDQSAAADKARAGSDATTASKLSEHDNRIGKVETDIMRLQEHDSKQELMLAGITAGKK